MSENFATVPVDGGMPVEISQKRRMWLAFRRNKTAMFGGIMAVIIVLVALFAPLLSPHDPLEQNVLVRLSPSSSEYWLGTDDFGRDVLEKPSGISLDRFENIWVIDAGLSMIFCFDREGELIYSEGGPGRDGPYSFRNPQDLTVLPGDMIAISDTGNDRVLIYKILYPE